MTYDNILKAVSGGNQLTNQQKADNYSAFNELMNNGVYIPELLQKMKQLEDRMNAIEKPKENPLDAELFTVMEQAVKDDPAVMNAKRALQNEKTRVISELCIKDDKYRSAFDDYRRAVNQAYVQNKEVKATSGE